MGFGRKWVKVDNLRNNLSNCATSNNVRKKKKEKEKKERKKKRRT